MAKSTRRLALAVVMFATLLAAQAGAEDARPVVDAKAIISRQLDAFANDDAAAAYALAAPGVKTIFADPDVFMAAVRANYAPVYRHRSVDFGDAVVDGDDIAITATLVDDDNQVWTALYKLAKQPDGQWLIGGCVLIKSEDKAL
jgi:uncharacterized protein DUF4864